MMGLNERQKRILQQIRDDGGYFRIHDVWKDPGLYSTLAALERRGYIERRGKLYPLWSLTEKGKEG